MLIKDKVVLVTGGGRNVGAGIVRSLAGHGATLAINCYQSVDLAQALAGSIEESGGKAGVWQCDIRDTDAVKKMVEDIVSRFGLSGSLFPKPSETQQVSGMKFPIHQMPILCVVVLRLFLQKSYAQVNSIPTERTASMVAVSTISAVIGQPNAWSGNMAASLALPGHPRNTRTWRFGRTNTAMS